MKNVEEYKKEGQRVEQNKMELPLNFYIAALECAKGIASECRAGHHFLHQFMSIYLAPQC